MKRRYLVLLGLLAFVVTLVLHAPAALLYAWAQPTPGAVRVHGVQGTLAQGGFAALTMNGRTVLTEGRWRLQPAWLALLRLSADLEAAGDSVVRVRVARSVFGTLRLSDLVAAGTVKSLLGVLGQPTLPIEGQARLDVPLLRFDGGVPIEAEGTAEVQNLIWTMSREPVPLGTFIAALTTDDKGILVHLESGPGPIELEGSATLEATRAYTVDLKLKLRDTANPQLQTLVRSLGQPDRQGFYSLRRSGTL